MTISALFLAPCAVRADVARPPQPPQEMVVKGTLSWDGAAEKNLLKLTAADDEKILLGPADKIKETKTGDPIVPEKLIGKKVALTLIGTRPYHHSRIINNLKTGKAEIIQPPPVPLDVKKVISLTLAKGS